MPIMNGHAATQQLRADPRFTELPILAMTAYAIGHELDLALREGMNGHIPKPFDPDELLAILSSYKRTPKQPPPAEIRVEPSDIPEQLLAIPELDIAALSHRFKGRSTFMLRMLQKFSADFGNFNQVQQDFLARNDTEGAMRHAHSLKGLAGTFGMTRLQRAALFAENSLRTEGTCSASLQQNLNNELSVVLDTIRQLDHPDSTGKVSNFEPKETQKLLDRLRHHLEEADGEAENLWANHKVQFSSIYTLAEMDHIERAISNWNFDQALAGLLRSTPENEKKS